MSVRLGTYVGRSFTMVIQCNGYICQCLTSVVIIKNLNADKPPTCTACRKAIPYREKYFTLPSSFQKYCLKCAPIEIPKLIEQLNKDLHSLQET